MSIWIGILALLGFIGSVVLLIKWAVDFYNEFIKKDKDSE
jgi:ABC-type transport system involved in cytochrome c biogenesis permease subunit